MSKCKSLWNYVKEKMRKVVKTERMNIYPISIKKLKKTVDKEKDEALKQAYQEMLDGCLKDPKNYLWYTLWFMELKEQKNTIIGNLSFKGMDSSGIVEIGYGINDGFEGKGYMTEAVTAMTKWALAQSGVKQVEAEAEETNIASIRVLEKSGFVPNGERGEEGPRFVWKE